MDKKASVCLLCVVLNIMQTSIILCVLAVSTLAILANGNFGLHLILPLTPQDYITNHAYYDLTPFF